MLDGPAERSAAGDLEQPFAASDDYGVVGGIAQIALDLAAVERRHGLAAEPEPREPVVLDLPIDFTGDGTEFTEMLVGEFAEHPWAGLPVTLTLTVRDAAGQEGTDRRPRRWSCRSGGSSSRSPARWPSSGATCSGPATTRDRVAQVLRAVELPPRGPVPLRDRLPAPARHHPPAREPTPATTS